MVVLDGNARLAPLIQVVDLPHRAILFASAIAADGLPQAMSHSVGRHATRAVNIPIMLVIIPVPTEAAISTAIYQSFPSMEPERERGSFRD